MSSRVDTMPRPSPRDMIVAGGVKAARALFESSSSASTVTSTPVRSAPRSRPASAAPSGPGAAAGGARASAAADRPPDGRLGGVGPSRAAAAEAGTDSEARRRSLERDERMSQAILSMGARASSTTDLMSGVAAPPPPATPSSDPASASRSSAFAGHVGATLDPSAQRASRANSMTAAELLARPPRAFSRGGSARSLSFWSASPRASAKLKAVEEAQEEARRSQVGATRAARAAAVAHFEAEEAKAAAARAAELAEVTGASLERRPSAGRSAALGAGASGSAAEAMAEARAAAREAPAAITLSSTPPAPRSSELPAPAPMCASGAGAHAHAHNRRASSASSSSQNGSRRPSARLSFADAGARPSTSSTDASPPPRVPMPPAFAARVTALFESLDRNGNGEVDLQEAETHWQSGPLGRFGTLSALAMFSEVDDDASHAISLHEWLAFWDGLRAPNGGRYADDEILEEVEAMLRGAPWRDWEDGRSTTAGPGQTAAPRAAPPTPPPPNPAAPTPPPDGRVGGVGAAGTPARRKQSIVHFADEGTAGSPSAPLLINGGGGGGARGLVRRLSGPIRRLSNVEQGEEDAEDEGADGSRGAAAPGAVGAAGAAWRSCTDAPRRVLARALRGLAACVDTGSAAHSPRTRHDDDDDDDVDGEIWPSPAKRTPGSGRAANGLSNGRNNGGAHPPAPAAAGYSAASAGISTAEME